MIVRLSFFLAVVCGNTYSLERNAPCTTPNNEAARCIPVRDCIVMIDKILANDAKAIAFAQNSSCGHDGKPLVCCGTTAYFTPVTVHIPNIPSKDLPDKTICCLEKKSARIIEGTATKIERNAPCTTPNNEAARCIPVRDCVVMIDKILANDAKAIAFAQNSSCGHDGKPLVCCGTTAYFTPVTVHIPNIPSKDLPDKTICGLERESVRIIGGTATKIGEFPWMAGLEFKSKMTGENKGINCGASLINKKYVLTAAHCLFNVELKPIRVWLGDWNITSDPDCVTYVANTECADPVQKIKIKKMIPHPYYSDKNNNNDIALIRLEREVEYTEYIRPICLPPDSLPDPDVNTLLTVVGWGATENRGTASDVKLMVDVPLLTNANCREKFPRQTITPNQLCAGGEDRKDSCQGDSGGPLMRTYSDASSLQLQWYLEGVVGYGVGCGRPGYPAIYTRVARYITWIVNNIAED